MEQFRENTSGNHCQLIKLDSHVPSKAASPKYTFALAYKKPRPIPKTWECMGDNNGTSLLDLPRELRDMIYGLVCDDMRRDGNGWRKIGKRASDLNHTDRKTTTMYQNCNIMRVCRQVHWEFAEVLYARPLQLTGVASRMHIVVTGSHILPLSKTYAHLFKKVALIHSPELDAFYGSDRLREEYLTIPDRYFSITTARLSAEDHWLNVVTATTRLVKLFPAVQIVRVLSEVRPPIRSNDTMDSLLGKCNGTREEQVQTAEQFMKAVRLNDTKKIKIPVQMVLLHIEDGILTEKPWGEALRNIQAAELHKKGLKEKS
ncbi:hypothetical protein G6011_11618 [Alternaria panax]|uniref:Uncharacterized protein n=1 Tax=Alternaria panax TaxID=48097 RepID=A0AAD4IE75_9PLEO|nr:hypothetical protein G6011_11618 [Alternaria panax]